MVRNEEVLLRTVLASAEQPQQDHRVLGWLGLGKARADGCLALGTEQFRGQPFSLSGLVCIVQLRNVTLLWDRLQGAGSVKAAARRSGEDVALPRSGGREPAPSERLPLSKRTP